MTEIVYSAFCDDKMNIYLFAAAGLLTNMVKINSVIYKS